MARQKSRFPSYGLVRGPSHAQGGVAGVVAGEQPVELEGGEWVVPKEAVQEHLPQLIQMTNEGRAMQGMDNGNSAIDALIASVSMQNGAVSPKSPHYQEGGEVDSLRDRKGQMMKDLYDVILKKPKHGPIQGTLGKYFAEMNRKEEMAKILEQAKLDSGRVLPRQQQEIRRPEMHGPPVPTDYKLPFDFQPLELDVTPPVLKDIEYLRQYAPDTSVQDTSEDFQQLLNRLRGQPFVEINPFTGDTIDWDAVKKYLDEQDKKSKILRTPARKKMQQGGMVGGPQLMQDMSQDRRIKPLQPDKYIIKQDVPGGTSQREVEIPKLSSAYLQAFGTETPLSRRQKSFFNSPEKPSEQYMNSFSGLNGRILLQRLIGESS